MSGQVDQTYPPLNTLKAVAEEVWIVDGPVIRFGMPWPKMPFPTRMTIMRLDDRRLFIHSPTPLAGNLVAELRAIGTPTWLVGPTRIHYWWLPDWHGAYPQAGVYLAPRIREQAGGRISFEASELSGTQGYPWDGGIDTLPVEGDFNTEVVFFHRRSRTLILTDLIENFEPARLRGWLFRMLTRLAHVQDPDGQMPRDMRLTFRRHEAALRLAVETMIGWNPARILLAHGRWYDRDGAAELRRAFRWLLR